MQDMEAVRQQTSFVAGLKPQPGKAGGDPSLWTALGVFESMEASARFTFGSDLAGLTIALQGVGNVGENLCRLASEAGARLILADSDQARAERLAEELGAQVVNASRILSVDADIFAPCALGGILSDVSIPTLKARLVCGAANNQLATESDGAALLERGIIYAPDYIVNAGGIINVAAEYLGETSEYVRHRVGLIAERLTSVLETAKRDWKPSNVVADELASEIIARGERGAV